MARLRALLALAAIALASLVVAGCTGSGGASPTLSTPTGPAHPHSAAPVAGAERATGVAERCRFVSMAAVAHAFGTGSIDETVGATGIGRPRCTFALQRTDAGASGSLTATLNAKDSPAGFRQVRLASHGTPVHGIGDRAFYDARTTTLQFMKGSSTVALVADIHEPGSGVPHPRVVRADLIALATAAAAQL